MKSDLLRLRKEIVRIAVEHHPAQRLEWNHFFRDDLGRVEDVERECRRRFLVERLHGELELRKISHRYRVEQVTALRVGIRAIQLH